MLATGQKLKKAQIKALPAPVADQILKVQARYNTRNCTLYIENPGWELYLAEATSYYGWRSNHEPFTLRMQSQASLHAGGQAQSHQIGRRIPVPEGSWIVEFELFLGKPILNVHHVGPYQLEG